MVIYVYLRVFMQNDHLVLRSSQTTNNFQPIFPESINRLTNVVVKINEMLFAGNRLR